MREPADSADGAGARWAWPRVLTAWLPLAAVYSLLLVIHADWPMRAAVGVGGLAIGVAAILGVPVWWVTGRLAWPDRSRAGFYAAHLALAAVFAVAWLLADLALASLLLPDGVLRQKLRSMHWEALLGVWLYGLVAGVSYAVRARRGFETQRRAAEHAAALAAQAELAALRAQLNPHFLFNALHSLGSLARDDPEGMDEALERLGDLLRQALATRATDTVPLADDLAFAENYLALEGLRLGDRLRVETAVDPEALDTPVPFLTLQPLVENAVRHGIDPLPEGGVVRVAATLAGDRLEITVADDGAGTPAVAPRGPGTGRPNGLGLGVLRRRLALTYGTFDLDVRSSPGAGCVVRVRFPAR